MVFPRLNQRQALAVVVMVLLVGSFMRAGLERWLTEPPRHVLDLALWPVRRPVHYVVGGFVPPRAEHSRTLERISKDYDDLERLFYRNQAELRDARVRINELSQTRQTLQENGQPFELVQADVTAWTDDLRYPTLRLDVGRSSGVAAGMVVVSGQSLVGRVSDVAQLTCTVALVSAPGTRLGASIASPAGSGEPPRQTLADLVASQDGRSFEARTDLRQTVKVGDVAYLDPVDSLWPSEARGFVIGQVTQVGPDTRSPLLQQDVVVDVEPRINTRTLNQVTILRPRADPAAGLNGR